MCIRDRAIAANDSLIKFAETLAPQNLPGLYNINSMTYEAIKDYQNALKYLKISHLIQDLSLIHIFLKIRRRRWTDTRTGKSFSIPINLDVVCKGTRYSKEFGAFLKETYGDVPCDLPYA